MAPPRTIGAYRVLDKIGEGGMGTVFLAEHTLLQRKAAIKVLKPMVSAHEVVVRRFFNEARAVTQIADPGIVQVFDFGIQDDGSAFIVMELLEGETMKARQARIGKFPLTDAVRLIRMTCTSLAAAHAKGIIHRDLKPDNIFIVGDPAVTGGERPKILDFGIAKLTGEKTDDEMTMTGVLIGTPVYMSPEQCRSAAEVDHRSDIYSIACVLFKLITGRAVFGGPGSGDVLAAHQRQTPPLAATFVPDLPPAIDQLLQRCLEKEPEHRFQSMHELADALGQVEQMLFHPGDPTLTVDSKPRMPARASAPPLPPPMVAASPPQPELPTPSPAPLPPAERLPVPSTLTQASGQSVSLRARGGSRWPVILGTALVTIAIVVGTVMYTNHQREPAPQPAAAPTDVAKTPRSDPPSAPSVTPIPTPPPTPPPTGPAPPAPNTPVTPDAAVPEALPPDAGMMKTAPPPPRNPPRHATTPPKPDEIDRGD